MPSITSLTELSTTPGANDVVPIVNLAAPVASRTKKITWANTKAFLKAYFDTLYAPIAKGVTNGDTHDHTGGDGAQIAYGGLSGLPTTINFVSRGDPVSADVFSFTTNGSYHDLDLSAIVPSGAKSVLLRVQLIDDAAATYIRFRKNGMTNSANVCQIFTQVAGVAVEGDFIVECDSNRIIEYVTTNTTITSVIVHVKGWYL